MVSTPFGKTMIALIPWPLAISLIPFVGGYELGSFLLGAFGVAGLGLLTGCFVPLIRR